MSDRWANELNWRSAVEASFGIGERGDQIRQIRHRLTTGLVGHFVLTGFAACLKLICDAPAFLFRFAHYRLSTRKPQSGEYEGLSVS
jgi:hypothetical protein